MASMIHPAGVLPRGSIEWMRAGNGVWHTGAAGPEDVKVFQLWVALPPELENAPFSSRYVMPEEVPLATAKDYASSEGMIEINLIALKNGAT